MDVEVQINTRLARFVIHCAELTMPVIGRSRAIRVARWASFRLVRWRVASGPWQRGFAREQWPEVP